MQALRALMRRLAPLTLLIALLGATGRLVAPAGLMPAAGPDGVHFVLCSGSGVLGAPGGNDQHDGGGDSACPFALVAAGGDAPLPAMAALAPPVAHIGSAVAHPAATPRSPGGIATRSRPATGPPVRA